MGDDDENGFVDDFQGWNFANGIANVQDTIGHGTHVAGIAAAATDNGIGVAGACPGCRIMPLRAFGDSGVASVSNVVAAVDYAVRNGAGVLSMSFGLGTDSTTLRTALEVARESAVLVAAAGNDGRERASDPFYPAAYDFVLGVEATEPGGAVAGYSNRGYELAAPGSQIVSTALGPDLATGDYATWSGTSMAAPLVAGIAGLVRSQNPGWSADLVFGQLLAADANAEGALLLAPAPALAFVSLAVLDPPGSCPNCDGDGVADAGETVDLVVTIRNLWDDATGVTATLSTLDPLASVTDASASYGNVAAARFADNATDVLRVALDPAITHGTEIDFTLEVTAGNGGSGINQTLTLEVARGVNKGGLLTANETWTKDNLYVVTQNLMIPPGITLVIEPGTTIEIADSVAIIVSPGTPHAALIAIGTAAEPITFKARGPGRWRAIELRAESTTFDASGQYVSGSILDRCHVKGSQRGVELIAQQGQVSNSWFADNARNIINVRANKVEGNLVEGGEWDSITLQCDASLSARARLRYNTVVGPSQLMVWSGGDNRADLDFGNCTFGQNTIFSSAGAGDYDLRLPTPSWHTFLFPENYWGTTDLDFIDSRVWDFFENSQQAVASVTPISTAPSPGAPAIVWTVELDPAGTLLEPYVPGGGPTPSQPVVVGEEEVTFTITFSRPMNTATEPLVTFRRATDPPEFEGHLVVEDPDDPSDGWQADEQTWIGRHTVSIFTGDGQQTLSITGAEDFDGFPLPSGDARFGFVVDTAGGVSRSLGTTRGGGTVCLQWNPSPTPDLAGYNVYRAPSESGPFQRLNSALVAETHYDDHTVEPGVVYYYRFNVVTSALLEGPDSNIEASSAFDDVPPVIAHAPVTSAPAGLLKTIVATITDNIAVDTATLFYRTGSTGPFNAVAMTAAGSQYSANIPAAAMTPPAVEYYLEATDNEPIGANHASSGSAGTPHAISIVDEPVILGIDPTSGPAAGGSTVTITGANFQDPPLVRFGSVASPSVTFDGPTQLTVTTPAHHPFLVDVEVENPNGLARRAVNAFTFLGGPLTLALPAASLADPGATVVLAVTTPSAAGLIAADFTVGFDPAVLTPLTPTPVLTGTLTAGFAVSANVGTPGQVVVSMAGSAPVTSTSPGSIAQLRFVTVGPPGSGTSLAWSGVVLNDGAIPPVTIDGQHDVDNAFGLGGTVTYWAGGAAVPDTTLQLAGSASATTDSAVDGSYLLSGVANGTYTLTPAKSDDHSAATISAFDASLVLQHANGITTLAGSAALAADVNRANGINAADAAQILQYAVGNLALPFNGAGGVWTFLPPVRSYGSVTGDLAGQDFTAILYGDPSGNWTAPAPRAAGGAATLALPVAWPAGSGETTTVPLTLTEGGDPVSLQLVVTYDPAVLTATGATTTDLTAGFALATNTSVPGEIRIALAGATPLATGGTVLELGFDVPGASGASSPLTIAAASLDEGMITVQTVDGSVLVGPGLVFADGFESGDSLAWSATVP